MYSVRNSVSSLSSAGETAFSISKRPPTSILLLLIGCWLFLWSITLDEVGCWNQLIESAQLIRAVVKIKRSSQNSYVSTLKKPLRGRMVPKQKHLSGRNRNRNRNLKTSKALLKSQAHQGTSLFTSAASGRVCPWPEQSDGRSGTHSPIFKSSAMCSMEDHLS